VVEVAAAKAALNAKVSLLQLFFREDGFVSCFVGIQKGLHVRESVDEFGGHFQL